VVPLDLGLPDNDGLSLARELRRASRIPIIVVSARGREEDKGLALDMGADHYITKPFGSSELLARIRVALRHAADLSAPAPMVVEVGSLRMDFASREVTLEHKPVRLTKNEFDLLAVLIRHAGQVITNSQLLQEVIRSHFGCQVDATANGTEGLARATQEHYDLVVSDICMPGMNGVELYLRLRELQPSMARRFLFVSGYAGDRKLDEQIRECDVPLVAKPFSIARLAGACLPFFRAARPAA